MRWRAMLVALLLMPGPARADALAFEFWPERNADTSVSCRIELRGGQIIVIEFIGSGMPPRLPLRWPVRQHEEIAILRALQALVSGDLPSSDAYSLRVPPPPYVVVAWSTEVNGAYVSGFYVQPHIDLPPVLAGLIDTVLPGGPCQSAISAPDAVPD
jgi:hypothetical protein